MNVKVDVVKRYQEKSFVEFSVREALLIRQYNKTYQDAVTEVRCKLAVH